jgi:hypothetical protein
MTHPGRSCPLHYRYGAAALASIAERPVDTLYVAGGLYGNIPALEALQFMVASEPHPATLCFNGDFNWFNCDDDGFLKINEAVLRQDAIQGNVEAELGNTAEQSGCGCAYPDSVDDATVDRSNQIHARLRHTASRYPELCSRLGELPMFARYRIGRTRVGIVHGDADSLAGWRFDVAQLDNPADSDWRKQAFSRAEVDVFASSHTCLPALRRYEQGVSRIVINNGAAGMPNFRDSQFGIVTRISVHASPIRPLYGTRLNETFIDALALHYDVGQWWAGFVANWPEDSPAWISYAKRIQHGPGYLQESAAAKVVPMGQQS